ncbi:MAG TPA: T9SS type A sorting domain-containing protein, partial [Candidatus Cloacimonadota bacterium]|nr:T9SS type A sorting domain-containing protein [Candidatus Cloacimonadota bacterium]
QNRIYRINLQADTFSLFYEHTSPAHYDLYPIVDDYLLAISQANPYEPNLLIDNQCVIHHLPGDTFYLYNVKGKIGEYYPAVLPDLVFYTTYAFLYVEHDSLGMVIDNVGGDYSPYEYDDSIISLMNDRYICISYFESGSGELLDKWFGTYHVVLGHRYEDSAFPDLSTIPEPRSITRINADYILALSGTGGNPISFALIDLDNQQINTNIISIDTNQLGWEVYPAGNNFYLLKENRVHTFRIAEAQGNDDQVSQVIPRISCYPNPFNSETTISYNLSTKGQVELNIYNIRGQLIRHLVNDKQILGKHTVTWNGKDDHGKTLASGIYFCRISSAGRQATRKMVLLK